MSQNYQRFKRIVIVSYRLPFKIVNKGSERSLEQNTGGLVSAILSLAEKMSTEEGSETQQKIVWIGHSEFSKSELEKMSSKEIEFDIYPITIPEKINTSYYEGFCNDMLWPLFHYFPMYAVFRDSYFDAFQKANHLFMDLLENVIRPDDLIWVHDYQLFLLPKLIRSKFPKSNIGFFLHIPFPSFEIFRLLKRGWREELLNGILGADLIGFHTNDYTQHFLYTVRRVLGLENSIRKIYTPERVIKADSFPIGIDYDKFSNAVTNESVLEYMNSINEIIGDKKLIFSVDRLDYTKGLLNKLLGYEHFLDNNSKWQGKVIFNMVVAPSRDKIPRYKKMKREIEATVGRINGKYSHIGWRPIVYQYKSISFNELVALYSISHCGLITPLRDGMNLVAKEYVACQGKNIGVLILSEMAGAVAELGEAIIINPTDISEVADAIFKALEMPLQERKEKIMRMKKRIQNYNIFSWTEDFINQIQLIKKEQDMLDIKLLNNTFINNIVSHYRESKKRLILLDYDGTLIPFSKYPEDALPDEKVIDQIVKLSGDRKNKVVIISGRDKKFLEKCLGKINVTLVAEHGVFKKNLNKHWDTMGSELYDNSWKKNVMPILAKYRARCNGSYVEEKETALVWHYRNSDPDFAFVRANELKEELNELLIYNKDLQLLEGNKIVEIKINGYDKGTAAGVFLESEDYDFILAIGDDNTDEELFKALPKESYSIKVGLVQSNAKYNLTHQYEVNALIDRLME